MPLDKIYWQQRVSFVALMLVVTSVRTSTLPRLFPDLNLLSAFLAVIAANFTSVKRADACLTDLLNTFVP